MCVYLSPLRSLKNEIDTLFIYYWLIMKRPTKELKLSDGIIAVVYKYLTIADFEKIAIDATDPEKVNSMEMMSKALECIVAEVKDKDGNKIEDFKETLKASDGMLLWQYAGEAMKGLRQKKTVKK